MIGVHSRVEVIIITKQITIKLNDEKFRPLIDKLNEFTGTGLASSDSELVGRALFYCYFSIFFKVHDRGTKTSFDVMKEHSGLDSSELVMTFLQEYSKFKKNGLAGLGK